MLTAFDSISHACSSIKSIQLFKFNFLFQFYIFAQPGEESFAYIASTEFTSRDVVSVYRDSNVRCFLANLACADFYSARLSLMGINEYQCFYCRNLFYNVSVAMNHVLTCYPA